MKILSCYVEKPKARAPQRKESLEVPEQAVSSKSHYPVIKRSKSVKAMMNPTSVQGG